MSDIENLEKKLESLVPRRPSAQIERRLFGVETVSAPLRSQFTLLACLAPATCCILLMCAHLGSWRPGDDGVIFARGNSNELASLTSNLLASCAAEALGGRENLWREVTFEWTKGGNSASTTGYFPVGKTNIQKL